MKKLILINLFVGLFACAYAQNADSVLQLREVHISAVRLPFFNSGNKITRVDSVFLPLGNNLADVLSQTTHLFVKSYGLGSLATPSMRGTGASHLATLWNGFNLQSSMNGTLDLALLPTFFVDAVDVQQGASSALFGNGAVGGVIHLHNTPKFDSGFSGKINLNAGSFNTFGQQIGLQIGKQKFASSLKIIHQNAQNNFKFQNTAKFGSPWEQQNNAELAQYGFLQENYIKLSDYQQIALRVWKQKTKRNVPSSMTSNASEASQTDDFWRVSAEWKRTHQKHETAARIAYFDEILIFKDKTINLDAFNQSRSVVAEVENKININKKLLLNIGLNNTFYAAYTDAYRLWKQQNRTALFASLKYDFLVISLRKEFISNAHSPVVASLSFEKIISNALFIKGNIAQSYRLPTFNDMFWIPGGNADLKAEKGFSQEIGLYFFKHSADNLFSIESNMTVFNNFLNNMIVWQPSTSYWQAQNIAATWSRGAEWATKISYQMPKIRLKSGLNLQMVYATNESQNDQAAFGKQLIYVPNFQGNMFVSVYFKRLFFQYNHTLTSKIFTTSDNNQFLKPYQLGSLSVVKDLKRVNFSLNINNLWSKTYQTIQFRAMPLRNYQLKMTINL